MRSHTFRALFVVAFEATACAADPTTAPVRTETDDNALQEQLDEVRAELDALRELVDVLSVEQSSVVEYQRTIHRIPTPQVWEDTMTRGLVPGRVLTFEKARFDTDIRVGYFETARAAHVPGTAGTCSCIWRVLFNGEPCIHPGPISTQFWVNAASTYHPRPPQRLRLVPRDRGRRVGRGRGAHRGRSRADPLPGRRVYLCVGQQPRGTLEAEEML